MTYQPYQADRDPRERGPRSPEFGSLGAKTDRVN